MDDRRQVFEEHSSFGAEISRAEQAAARYNDTRDPSAIDAAIDNWEQILHHPDYPTTPPRFRRQIFRAAGIAYRERYNLSGRRADLDAAITVWGDAASLSAPGSPEPAQFLNNVSVALRDRFVRFADQADLDEAIAASERAEEATPHDSPNRAIYSYNLGLALLAQYRRTASLDDLARSIGCFEGALDDLPAGSPHRSTILNGLGSGLSTRYSRTGDIDDLTHAIEQWELAVDATLPETQQRANHLNSLGHGLKSRFDRTGSSEDLDRAILVWEEAVAATPLNAPSRRGRRNNLGLGLKARYRLAGNVSDLELAILEFRASVEGESPASLDYPARLSNLANALRHRYLYTGQLSDLEEAIRLLRDAAANVTRNSPDRLAILNNLGLALNARFWRTKDPTDLSNAIEALREATHAPSSGVFHDARFNSLAVALRDRYLLSGTGADLEEAVSIWEEIVTRIPASTTDRPRYLNNLGLGMRNRYARTRDTQDLARAIACYDEALSATPASSSEYPARASNLANALNLRYAAAGAAADLAMAIAISRRALAASAGASIDQLALLYNAGVALINRYAQSGRVADLDAAIDTWERAWTSLCDTFPTVPVAYKLGQQREWTGLGSSLVGAYTQRAEAHPAGAQSATRRAFEIAEASKSRLFTETVGRGDIPAPTGVRPDIAVREREALTQLTILDTLDLLDRYGGIAGEDAGGAIALSRFQTRDQIRTELGQLWDVIARAGRDARQYVALRRGDTLAWEDFVRLAANLGPAGAILSLFVADDRTYLFVLRHGWTGPQVIQQDIGQQGWEDVQRRFVREVRTSDRSGRRGETWWRLLRPLFDQATPHLDGVTRIMVVPMALGHNVPWSVVFDRLGWHCPDGSSIALVTTPSLGLWSRLRSRSVGEAGRALVVGDPLGDLSFAEDEARSVAISLLTEPLIGAVATKEAVLTGLARVHVAHIAAHGSFVAESPLDSGIVLADGVLTAREIMAQRLQADLVVLSGYETGMTGSLGGEEMVGLAQAFLHAGARSVLVSLWRVDDPATAAFMVDFYRAYRAGHDKANALGQAVAHVRSVASWHHPFYWGAFSLVGDC
ncbi:MAG: CHAT domain-containing protein [Chloroflexota bacterium]|nr:CHAT domain-containing protein [Chloroflexota bacterium]